MNKMIAAVSLVFLTASSLAGAADWSGKVLKLGWTRRIHRWNTRTRMAR